MVASFSLATVRRRAKRGCAQAAVETTREVVARSGAFPHYPQPPLRKKFLESFWGCRLFSVRSKEKSACRYLKSPLHLPKVPTPRGRYRATYLKSPLHLPKVPTPGFVRKSAKNLCCYLKSPLHLPKVPTPRGRYRATYLKSPPSACSRAGLSTGRQGGALHQGILIARLILDRRCANKRADRRAGTRRSALAHRHP